MKEYYENIDEDPFLVIPLTYHIEQGLEDLEYHRFKDYFIENGGVWILKPGEDTNWGAGIVVRSTLTQIEEEIELFSQGKHSVILQRYIANPLLINQRKFDIRVFAMVTSVNGSLKGYFYEDGYIRTSCVEFSLENLENRFIHLTNDAVQKHAEEYGKFENGNKVSYQQL